MDPSFYVVREERRRVIFKRHVAPQLEDPVRVLVMEPSAEHFHMNMVARHQDHGHGKQISVLEATHNVNVHNYQRPPVATQVQYQQPISQTQQASLRYHNYDHQQTLGKVIDSNEAARIYGGVLIRGTQAPPPPPVKKLAPGKVIDSNEAARIYGGFVIKGRLF